MLDDFTDLGKWIFMCVERSMGRAAGQSTCLEDPSAKINAYDTDLSRLVYLEGSRPQENGIWR